MKVRFADEFAGVELPDARLGRRLGGLAQALWVEPAASLPESLRDGAALEAAYRFFSNDGVTAEAVLGPHYRETAGRCRERPDVVVPHDTTDFAFAGERKGLGRLRGTKERGFLAHVAIAVGWDRWREPLGALSHEVWTRGGKRTGSKREKARDPTRESTRWLRGVTSVEERLGHGFAVHVMDREADVYELFDGMMTIGARFVVRARSDRNLVDDARSMMERVESRRVIVKREVYLSKREKSTWPTLNKLHPPREAREATLAIRACTVTIKRPSDLPRSIAAALEVNVVLVDEVDVPRGQPPVRWCLITNEPINTAKAVERVVDAYRSRWRIEEYFKALKTGCAIEKRQLGTLHALTNLLAVYMPIAWRILRLRSIAQANAKRPASAVLSQLQIRILRRKLPGSLPGRSTVADALQAIAKLGGHLKRNGDPGWITLGRGYERLLTLEEGARLAQ